MTKTGTGPLEARRSASTSTTSPAVTQAQDPAVTYEIETITPGHEVATITIRNPRKLNIANKTILESLVTTCKTLSSNEALRAVILTGGPTAAGKQPSFIGGADITEMHQLFSSDAGKAFISRVHAACRALRNLPVPVIARIHGFALGAGLEIAAVCDLRIATKTSIFGMPEVKIGIPSVVEAALLPGLIGMGRTRRLLYLAENISADEAERWGLVERIVADETELDAAVKDWVGKIGEMGLRAIRSQKRLMQKWENVGVDEGIAAGIDAFGEAYEDGGKEPRELMRSFVGGKKTKL